MSATVTHEAHQATTTRPTRATLRTRPRIQRSLIRSWDYIPSVRASVLIVRLLVTAWLIVLGAVLMSAGHAWGWILLPAAAAVFAIGVWAFSTAGKGWPTSS